MAWFTCPAIRRAACLATRRSFVLGSLRYYATRGPSSQRGHYDVLGVSLTATQDDIKVAFRQVKLVLFRRCHSVDCMPCGIRHDAVLL